LPAELQFRFRCYQTPVFGQVRPASTLVQVAALTPAMARVEVEATAVIAD